jgi:mono/diheme cytochrome c family protein
LRIHFAQEGLFAMTSRVRMTSIAMLMVGVLLTVEGLTWAADRAVMRPRVPRDQIEAARAVTNPLPADEEMIAKGKALYEGKAFCKVCHGPDGKGLGADIAQGSLKGPLPRNFTDKKWQAARTDGELFWILKNGSKGTAMAPFIPLILSEEEAWQVLRYVRSFGQP